jgi:L-alanine-DL-glutamate epimerase-like enolase superfamily enzyme
LCCGKWPRSSRSSCCTSTFLRPSAAWVEYIPQLDAITTSRLAIEDGYAVAPDTPGLGIEWRWNEIERRARARHLVS